MDPLSVTASIIAVVGVAGKAFQGLEYLRARMSPDLDFLLLMNSVIRPVLLLRSKVNSGKDDECSSDTGKYSQMSRRFEDEPDAGCEGELQRTP